MEKFEQKENVPVVAETLSREELIDIIYKGGYEEISDKRFLPVEEGGVFKYLDISNIINPHSIKGEELYYPVVKLGDEIIGLAELEKSPREDNVYWIKFLSVDPKYQNRGFGSKLTEEVFRFAKGKGIVLQASPYSQDGFAKLKPLQNRLAKEMGVDFRDTDRTTFFEK